MKAHILFAIRADAWHPGGYRQVIADTTWAHPALPYWIQMSYSRH